MTDSLFHESLLPTLTPTIPLHQQILLVGLEMIS